MQQEEQLILVDIKDRDQGVASKNYIHQQGLLHRAFSVIIFNRQGELLLQKRAETKYHSAGLWSNACCGHPTNNEPLKKAAERRLFEELGFTCYLSKITELSYFLSLGNGMYENEYTHIFVGEYNKSIAPNVSEVSEVKWEKLEVLKQKLHLEPKLYSKWFELYMNEYYQKIFIRATTPVLV